MSQGEELNGASSGLGRALQVIYAIANSPYETVGVSELSRQLSLPKAVVHRILKSLALNDLLELDMSTRRYRFGPGALVIGLAALRNLDMPRQARPVLDDLVRETAETATLSMRQGDFRTYVAQVLSPQEVKMSVVIGRRFPLYAGSSSKCMLAMLSSTDRQAYFDRVRLDPLTPATITGREELEKELERVRRAGFAVSRGERESDAGSVAAAVLDAGGEVWGSVSICGPGARFERSDIPRYGTLVKQAAVRLSETMGYRPPTLAADR